MIYRFKLHALPALLTLLSSSASAADVWDLKSDWSDSQNPNGAWSYNGGSLALPHISSSTLPGGGLVNQGGWAACNSCRGFWFKATVSSSGADWLLGDIVVHTQDQYANPYDHDANVTWTSPINGIVNISGSLWMDDFFTGRGNQWNLYVRGQLVSSGQLSGTDPYDRNSPFSLTAGSGGALPLTNVPVAVGDVVELQIVRTTFDGFFVGTNLTIAAVPEPQTQIMWLAGLAGIVAMRRRNRTDA